MFAVQTHIFNPVDGHAMLLGALPVNILYGQLHLLQFFITDIAFSQWVVGVLVSHALVLVGYRCLNNTLRNLIVS